MATAIANVKGWFENIGELESRANPMPIVVGNWTIWIVSECELPKSENEMDIDEFIQLPLKSRLLSFWDDGREDIYTEEDGEPL